MELSIRKIAELSEGEIIGDGNLLIKGVADFDEAGPGDISLAVAAKYIKRIDETQAGALIVPLEVEQSKKTIVRVKDPYLALAKISGLFHKVDRPASGINQMAFVGENFTCGEDVSISSGVSIGDDVILGDRVVLHAGVVIGNGVVIGSDTIVYPNVSILKDCRIGNRVIIHAGSVIGSDGFGFASDGERHIKIPQTGIVRIDDDVEIGACNTIDRATFGETWIKRGVKTDNLVHIAHNVVVGEDSLLVAQVAISGSVTVGHHAIFAGQVGIAPHLTIGNHVTVIAQSGIGRNIPDGEIVSGSPSMPHRLWLKTRKIITKLPEMRKKLREMEKRIQMLEGKTGEN